MKMTGCSRWYDIFLVSGALIGAASLEWITRGLGGDSRATTLTFNSAMNKTLRSGPNNAISLAGSSETASTADHGVASSPAIVLDVVRQGWTRLAGHPTGSLEGTSVWHKGELWIITGFPCPSANDSNIWRYLPDSDEWRAGPSLRDSQGKAIHLNHLFGGATSSGDTLSIIGGLRAYAAPDNRVFDNPSIFLLDTARPEASWIWDEVSPKWAAAQPTDTLGGITSCSLLRDPDSGVKYCVMGTLLNFAVNDTFRFVSFHPDTLEVRPLPLPPPQAHMNHVTILSDFPRKRLVMLPGRTLDAQRPLPEIYTYDIALQTWALHARLPAHIAGFEGRGSVQHPSGKYALLFGGQDDHLFIVTPIIYRVNIGADISLEPLGLLPSPVFAPAVEFAPLPPPSEEERAAGRRLQPASGSGGGGDWNRRPWFRGLANASDSDSDAYDDVGSAVYVIGGSMAVGPNCVADAWHWRVPATPPGYLASSSVLIPYEDESVGNGEHHSAADAAVHLEQNDAAEGEQQQQPQAYNSSAVAKRANLRVVAAFYGPFLITDDIQRLLDAGVRVLHMGCCMVPLPQELIILPELEMGVLQRMKGRGKYPLNVVLLESPSDTSLPAYVRTVSCTSQSACLLY